MNETQSRNAEFQYCGRSYLGEILAGLQGRIPVQEAIVQIALAPSISEECHQRHDSEYCYNAKTNGISMSL